MEVYMGLHDSVVEDIINGDRYCEIRFSHCYIHCKYEKKGPKKYELAIVPGILRITDPKNVKGSPGGELSGGSFIFETEDFGGGIPLDQPLTGHVKLVFHYVEYDDTFEIEGSSLSVILDTSKLPFYFFRA